MNNMKQLFWGFCLMVCATSVWGQNEADVLRYGWIDPLASARVTAMGGSFGALGADLSCMGINPAGLGMYRRGDLSVSTGVHSSATTSQWGTRQVDAASADFVGSSVGIALTYPSVDADWPFFTLAIGYQNRMPFGQNIELDEVTSEHSVSALFVDQALADAAEYGYASTDEALQDGIIFPYSASLAWRTGLLLESISEGYASAVDGNATFDRNIRREGRLAETQIAVGTSFRDRLSFGVTLGLPKVRFEEQSNHSESPVAPTSGLGQWRYDEQLTVTGRGTLLRFGVLARVSNAMRLGLAYQTRGRLTLLDKYATTLSTEWLDGTNDVANSPTLNAEYVMLTPDRLTVSTSFLMGKLGVINADYVRSDMRRGELRDSDGLLAVGYDFGPENDAVQDAFQTVHQARVGLEIRLGQDDQLRLRTGGGMSTSPFSIDAVTADANRYHVSVGGGFRISNVHFSAAWRTAWHAEDYFFLGASSDAPSGQIEQRASALLLSAGLRM